MGGLPLCRPDVVHDPHRLHADPRHPRQQVGYPVFVVGEAVGVERLADGRVLWSARVNPLLGQRDYRSFTYQIVVG